MLVCCSGGFGIVYKAMLDSATPVAVKFVTNQSPKEQDRFKREVGCVPVAGTMCQSCLSEAVRPS